MNQSVGVSKSRCNANRHDEAKDDTDNTSQGQEDSVLNTLEWTKDEAGVDEHEKVTTGHEEMKSSLNLQISSKLCSPHFSAKLLTRLQ